jgi:hypothetical protein
MMELPHRDSQEYAEALVRAQFRAVVKARQNPTHFYSYVMREETTKVRLRALPFQELVFAFVMENPHCVVRLPVGGSKTYMMAALTKFLLGEDPTSRGAIVSATQEQAKKPLALVRDYIENSAELRAVYPKLRPSTREGDPWTQTAITVDRPFGIRDPSLVAVGVDGSIPGARINWCLVDDILNLSNTSTLEQRDHVRRWFVTTLLSRLDIKGSRLVVTNTPWHGPTTDDVGDLTYFLESKGWPTLTITVWGDVIIKNAPNFDSHLIRPAADCEGPEGRHRLVPHDDPAIIAETYREADLGTPTDLTKDVDELVTFWPDRFPRTVVEAIKQTDASSFAQNYEMKAASESSGKIQESWIQSAKSMAVRMGIHAFVPCIEDLRTRISLTYAPDPYKEPVLYDTVASNTDFIVASGVDLAIGKKKSNARTVIFTIAVIPPDMRRLVIDIEAGRWSGKEIVSKIIAKHEAFGTVIRVENNAAQDFLLQWIRETDKSVPIKAHTTGKNKADPTNGVESLFIEIENGAWIIPTAPGGKSPPNINAWLQDCRQYNPGEHTGDFLMAAWMADWQAKKMGANLKKKGLPPSVLLTR